VQDERARMGPEELAAADAVIDLDADESTCPACTGTIPRGAARCPECGLRLG
jgi:predicted amidophosphoribosyltransferase